MHSSLQYEVKTEQMLNVHSYQGSTCENYGQCSVRIAIKQ